MSRHDPQEVGHLPGSAPGGKLRLAKETGKLAGVCSGLAEYLGLDANIIRLIFVLGALLGFGSFILIYLAIWLLVD